MGMIEKGAGLNGETISGPSNGLDSASHQDTAFFGHPRGLGFLAGTEMWERFSFYAMQALLMLYMTKYLLLPVNVGRVVGLETYRSVLVSVFGPMTNLALAAQTFGLYSGLILVTPMVGAWLGDRVLGRVKTITIGALLMSAGHLTMASERAFLLALLLLILGGGCLLGNLSAQIGGLYPSQDNRRARAFGIYLMALNVGAFMAPLVAGTMGERLGFHWGFGAAGVGMLIGLATYLSGRRFMPPDLVARGRKPPKLDRAQWVTFGAIILTLVPKVLLFGAAQQAYGIMVVWADTAVNRRIGSFEVPVTWILTADGLITILGVLLANRVWDALAARGREPSDVIKIGIGGAAIAAAFIIVGLLASQPRVPLVGWLGFYLVLGLSYAWMDPPGKAIIGRYAPQSINGMVFAFSALFAAFGFFLLGYLGRFYEPLGPSRYYLLTALMPALASAFMLTFARPIQRLLGAAERDAGHDPLPAEPFPPNAQ
jgi:POT family proton-dependent oligopeptide transporter